MKSQVKASIAGQIIGSFEDLGKDIVREVVKAPADMVGIGSPPTTKEKTVTTSSEYLTQATARKALEYLLGQKKPELESIWEKQEKEKVQIKQKKTEQDVKEAKSRLPQMWQKPKRGNIYQSTQQKAGSETSRNVRGD